MSAAGGAAMAGILIANNVKRLNDGIRDAPTAWAPLAARGLRLEIEDERPSMTGGVHGVDCRVRIVTDLVQNPHTEIIAERDGDGERIGVYPSPAGLLKWMRDRLHGDVDIGVPDFDEAFLIKSKPEAAAKALLTESIRAGLTALAGGKLVGLRVEDDKVTVLLNDIERDPTVIGVALDIVVEVAKQSAL